ncbi:MAG: hypothetical protein OXI15_21385 [Chromatiales bacterium]|nr:hypothetical protein [Chromatiales bacterium]
MFDKAAQHFGIHPLHRDTRLVKPYQDVAAGAAIAHERIRRIALRRALGQELLEQAQALVELARMRDASCLLEESNEPERSGDELPGPPGKHLATLAFHSRTPAIVSTKAPQHGAVNHTDLNALAVQPDQKVARRRPKAADPASRQAFLLQVLDERRNTAMQRITDCSRPWTARVRKPHCCSPLVIE